jgi:hypothetical protein
VFNASFNNISVVLWHSVLLVDANYEIKKENKFNFKEVFVSALKSLIQKKQGQCKA